MKKKVCISIIAAFILSTKIFAAAEIDLQDRIDGIINFHFKFQQDGQEFVAIYNTEKQEFRIHDAKEGSYRKLSNKIKFKPALGEFKKIYDKLCQENDELCQENEELREENEELRGKNFTLEMKADFNNETKKTSENDLRQRLRLRKRITAGTILTFTGLLALFSYQSIFYSDSQQPDPRQLLGYTNHTNYTNEIEKISYPLVTLETARSWRWYLNPGNWLELVKEMVFKPR